jgi:catalase
MLQARLFSYGDTQRYRLGVNFNHIPVNPPKCPFHSYHPTARCAWTAISAAPFPTIPTATGYGQSARFAEPPLPLEGEAARWDHYEKITSVAFAM